MQQPAPGPPDPTGSRARAALCQLLRYRPCFWKRQQASMDVTHCHAQQSHSRSIISHTPRKATSGKKLPAI